MKTILLTGATQGLGLAIARALDDLDDVRLVLPVRDVPRGEAVARALRHRARVVPLDLSSLAAVRAFATGWGEPLHALVNNAGLSLPGPLVLTPEGHEMTLAVNWLAPMTLTLALLPWLEGGRVLNVGSGTHNPEHPMASRFGFSGGHFSSIDALARGEAPGRTERAKGLDRYATSKLLVTAATPELARRYPATTFLTLDPGLMAGTGLLRSAPAVLRVLAGIALGALTPVLPDASTPTRSARAARWLLTSDDVVNGEVYDYENAPCRRVWSGARDPELARTIVDETTRFLGFALPTSHQGDVREVHVAPELGATVAVDVSRDEDRQARRSASA